MTMFESQDYNCIKKINIPDRAALQKRYPLSASSHEQIVQWRKTVADILAGRDRRLLLIVGPCSVHNADSTLEYARKLNELRVKYLKNLFIVMRCYVEKSRTGNSWPGFALDPRLDGSFDIEYGIAESRQLMLKIAALGMPLGMEFVFPPVSEFFTDILSWGCIGARCASSPLHRFFASGVNMPVGIKNPLSGDLDTVINALETVSNPQCLISAGKEAILTAGNPAVHAVFRGSRDGGNYMPGILAQCAAKLHARNFAGGIVVDCSHGNSHAAGNQEKVFASLLAISPSPAYLRGIMLESFLESGKTGDFTGKKSAGISLTDACLSFSATACLLEKAFQYQERK